jgi:SHAQKYF class myb-like DNA-binding protein
MNQSQGEVYQGRWTDAEHELFQVAFETFGKNWKKISKAVTSRTNIQCRTHAQKQVSGPLARQRPKAPLVKVLNLPYNVMSPCASPRVYISAENKPEVRLEDIVAYLESRVKRVRGL